MNKNILKTLMLLVCFGSSTAFSMDHQAAAQEEAVGCAKVFWQVMSCFSSCFSKAKECVSCCASPCLHCGERGAQYLVEHPRQGCCIVSIFCCSCAAFCANTAGTATVAKGVCMLCRDCCAAFGTASMVCGLGCCGSDLVVDQSARAVKFVCKTCGKYLEPEKQEEDRE